MHNTSDINLNDELLSNEWKLTNLQLNIYFSTRTLYKASPQFNILLGHSICCKVFESISPSSPVSDIIKATVIPAFPGTAQSQEATGGMYNEQWGNQRKLITHTYWEFLAQEQYPITDDFPGVTNIFSIKSINL